MSKITGILVCLSAIGCLLASSAPAQSEDRHGTSLTAMASSTELVPAAHVRHHKRLKKKAEAAAAAPAAGDWERGGNGGGGPHGGGGGN